MATKKKPASNVTRIRTSSSKAPAAKTNTTPAAKKKSPAPKVATVKTTDQAHTKKFTGSRPVRAVAAPFAAIWRYLKGSWSELRQVHWPNRRATWSLTSAVLLFTGFFTALILLLDAGFKYIFELVLG